MDIIALKWSFILSANLKPSTMNKKLKRPETVTKSL